MVKCFYGKMITVFLTVSLLFSTLSLVGAASENDIVVLRGRLYSFDAGMTIPGDIVTHFQNQNANGSWSDISYVNISSARTHINRVMWMSGAYKRSGHVLRNNNDVKIAIEKGLQYWTNLQLTDTNWWWCYIGQQQILMRTLSIMYGEINNEIYTQAINILTDHTNPNILDRDKTGTNLFWLAQQAIYKGALTNNMDKIYLGINALADEISITTSEGIQPDYSFHQHGAQLYNNGYGRDFLKGNAQWMYILRDTHFQFPQEKIELIVNLFLEGNRWMLRRAYTDLSAAGREVARKDAGYETAFSTTAGYLSAIFPQREQELQELRNHILGSGQSYSTLGNKYFYRSDYISHQREGYYSTVSGSSNRVVGTEQSNAENSKGKWLAYGTHYLYRNANDYYGIYPFWDWTKIPGVTAPNRVDKYTGSGRNVSNNTNFAGGVSNGEYGAMVMKMNDGQTSANKSWFFFDNEIVAMGSGIKSTAFQQILTTIDQRGRYGNIRVDGSIAGHGNHSNVNRVHHDNIGYIFPSAKNIGIRAQTVTSSWNELDSFNSDTTYMTKDMFGLWINHGYWPSNSTYEYITIPNIELNAFNNYNNPISIIGNSSTLQGVYHNELNVGFLIFYSAGVAQVTENLSLSTDKACIIMLKVYENDVEISFASPTATADTINVQASNGETDKQIFFSLPSGMEAGKTVTINLEPQEDNNTMVVGITPDLPGYKTNAILTPTYDYKGSATEGTSVLEWQSAYAPFAPDHAWETVTFTTYANQANSSEPIVPTVHERIFDVNETIVSNVAKLYLTQNERGKYIRFKLTIKDIIGNALETVYSTPTPVIVYEHNLYHNSTCESTLRWNLNGANSVTTVEDSEKGTVVLVDSTNIAKSVNGPLMHSLARAFHGKKYNFGVKIRVPDEELPQNTNIGVFNGGHATAQRSANRDLTDEWLDVMVRDQVFTDSHPINGHIFMGFKTNSGDGVVGSGKFMVTDVHFSERKPIAENVRISGNMMVGSVITGHYSIDYSYDHTPTWTAYGIGTEIKKWYKSDYAWGPWTEIEGEEENTLLLTEDLAGQYIKFELTPSDRWNNFGVPVMSTEIAQIIGTNAQFEGELVSEGSIGVNAVYVNEEMQTKTFLGVLAVYETVGDLKKLISTKIETKQITAGNYGIFALNTTFPETTGDLEAKFFIWDENAVPYFNIQN